MLYTLTVHSVISQLYLKTGGQKKENLKICLALVSIFAAGSHRIEFYMKKN